MTTSASSVQPMPNPYPTPPTGDSDREAPAAELRPLIGAHADVVANHLAAAGYGRPATGDTLTACPNTKFPDGTRCGERGWHATDCPGRRTGEFNRAFPTTCPDCPHLPDAHQHECADADCGCDRSRDEFAVSVPRTGEADLRARIGALRDESKSRGRRNLLTETGESVAGMIDAALATDPEGQS